jgi:hypothetical protein
MVAPFDKLENLIVSRLEARGGDELERTGAVTGAPEFASELIYPGRPCLVWRVRGGVPALMALMASACLLGSIMRPGFGFAGFAAAGADMKKKGTGSQQGS